MTTVNPIAQKYLPIHLHEIAANFVIPDKFIQDMSDLIILILESKSLDKNEEKQSRFNLLPLMNNEQIDKLKDILTREKQKLAEIEQKYTQKKQEMSEKFVKKFEEGAYQKKIQSVREQEQKNRHQEHEEADTLLNQI
jgi:hypothetical protein